jgi:hypothetical protein
VLARRGLGRRPSRASCADDCVIFHCIFSFSVEKESGRVPRGPFCVSRKTLQLYAFYKPMPAHIKENKNSSTHFSLSATTHTYTHATIGENREWKKWRAESGGCACARQISPSASEIESPSSALQLFSAHARAKHTSAN